MAQEPAPEISRSSGWVMPQPADLICRIGFDIQKIESMVPCMDGKFFRSRRYENVRFRPEIKGAVYE